MEYIAVILIAIIVSIVWHTMQTDKKELETRITDLERRLEKAEKEIVRLVNR
jgi:cell division protein FtsL